MAWPWAGKLLTGLHSYDLSSWVFRGWGSYTGPTGSHVLRGPCRFSGGSCCLSVPPCYWTKPPAQLWGCRPGHPPEHTLGYAPPGRAHSPDAQEGSNVLRFWTEWAAPSAPAFLGPHHISYKPGGVLHLQASRLSCGRAAALPGTLLCNGSRWLPESGLK